MSFKLTSSPHTRQNNKTSNVMKHVALACIPGILAQLYFFGIGVLFQILICIAAAMITEAVCLRLRHRRIRPTINDNSALLTGLLLGICLPPLSPWWLGIVGTVFAIALVKQAYGGLGQNIFNPAMAGYVLLLISFPVSMTSWLPPASIMQYELSFIDALYNIFTGYTRDGYSINQLRSDLDGITMATPLDTLKTGLSIGHTYSEIIEQPVFSNGLGVGWFTINIAYLAGGVYLLKNRIIKWHIPVSFIATLAFLSMVGQLISPDGSTSMLIHLTSGATLFAAFFILTDPVSASTTNRGRVIYGAFVGFMVFVIRTWGGYPEAVAFAVLLANMTVPLIDYYTQPRVYGHKEK